MQFRMPFMDLLGTRPEMKGSWNGMAIIVAATLTIPRYPKNTSIFFVWTFFSSKREKSAMSIKICFCSAFTEKTIGGGRLASINGHEENNAAESHINHSNGERTIKQVEISRKTR